MTRDGGKREVYVDDYVPCYKPYGEWKPVFARAKGNELWVLILEKVWAKLHGDYVKIVSGNCRDTFRDMTGAPSFSHQSVDSDREESIFDILLDADRRGYMMCCSCRFDTQEEKDNAKSLGLVHGHAYSLISVKELTDVNGNQAQVVQVRNPWGDFEWNGDWGDNSDLWTQEARDEIKQENLDGDGIFCIAIPDFVKCFKSAYVCKIVDGYEFSDCALPIEDRG